MNYVISIILGVIGYFILMVVGTNLIGLFVRGFFVKEETGENATFSDHTLTLIAFLANIAFLFCLYKYINVWAFVAALLLISSRIPDLIWEIKHKQKITRDNMPKEPKDYLLSMLDWIALPISVIAVYFLIK